MILDSKGNGGKAVLVIKLWKYLVESCSGVEWKLAISKPVHLAEDIFKKNMEDAH